MDRPEVVALDLIDRTALRAAAEKVADDYGADDAVLAIMNRIDSAAPVDLSALAAKGFVVVRKPDEFPGPDERIDNDSWLAGWHAAGVARREYSDSLAPAQPVRGEEPSPRCNCNAEMYPPGDEHAPECALRVRGEDPQTLLYAPDEGFGEEPSRE